MSNVSIPYSDRERLGLNEDVKGPIRNYAVEFIAQGVPASTSIQCFSLPSVHWRFERQLAKERAECSFIAVERDRKVFKNSGKNMPGKKAKPFILDLEPEPITGVANESHVLFRSSASKFLRLGREESEDIYDEWYKGFYVFNCAWLDFCCPYSKESINSISCLVDVLDLDSDEIPVIVTLIRGREQPEITKLIQKHGGRDALLTRLIEQSDSWGVYNMKKHEYTSTAGQPLVTYFLTLKQK